MVTKLHGVLKREIQIKGRAYVLALDATGIKLTLKGRRRGQELTWEDFSSGEAALATALNASLANANDSPRSPPKPAPSAVRAKAKKKKRR